MNRTDRNRAQRRNIGIIAGSGPEAGVDLWNKVLAVNKQRFGRDFRGDLDAPHVTIISDPELGLSMELERYHDRVWERLEEDVRTLSGQVAYYAIACNTLNVFEDRIKALDLPGRLISFCDCVLAHIRRHNLRRVCLFGARPVMDLGVWSAYRTLPRLVEVEVLPAAADLHQLIYDVKTYGPRHNGLAARFEEMLGKIESEVVLLACTELPLIPRIRTSKQLVDVTQLVAQELVAHSFVNPGDSV
jgi:aspartate racemase